MLRLALLCSRPAVRVRFVASAANIGFMAGHVGTTATRNLLWDRA